MPTEPIFTCTVDPSYLGVPYLTSSIFESFQKDLIKKEKKKVAVGETQVFVSVDLAYTIPGVPT